LVWSRLCSFGRRRLSHCGSGPIGKDDCLVLSGFLRPACVQSLWWRADRQGRWFELASGLQYATHYPPADPNWNEPFLMRCCVLIFKHLQIPHFLHLSFFRCHVCHVLFVSGFLGQDRFLPCYRYNRLTQWATLLTPTPGIFCILSPHPTLSLYT
jgi:hypothetical protein